MSCKEKMQMQHKMNDKPKPCDGNSCVNCPLINTFTVQALYTASIFHPVKSSFHAMEIKTVSGIYRQVWRPPDVS